MKLTKVLLGSAFAVSSVAIPVTTLSSCGTSWGVLTPFSIGGTTLEDGPFGYMRGDTYYDANGESIIPYLQSNYSVDVKNSVNYAYATPMKWKEKDKWEVGSSGWYTSSDEAFASTHTYDDEGKSQTSTNSRNATLSANTDFITTIGSTIKTYLEAALKYQSSQIDSKNLESSEKNLGIAWGSAKGFILNHGLSQSQSIKDFYEYLFANANINAGGKSKATLRTCSVDYQFYKTLFIPNYKASPEKGLSVSFTQLLEDSRSFDNPRYYNTKETITEDGTTYTRLTYKSVPIAVWVRGIKQTYLDITNKKGSFLASDYYSSSNDIKESIGDAWKKTIPKFTGGSEDESIPHYKSFNLTTNSVSAIDIDVSDERISYVDSTDFIALVDYTVDHYDDETKTKAQITKLSNLFPSYLLDIYGDEMYTSPNADHPDIKIIDTNKVDEKTSTLLQLLNRTSKEGMKARAEDLNDESKQLLSFLGYMFLNSEDGKTINTDEMFKLVDL